MNKSERPTTLKVDQQDEWQLRVDLPRLPARGLPQLA